MKYSKMMQRRYFHDGSASRRGAASLPPVGTELGGLFQVLRRRRRRLLWRSGSSLLTFQGFFLSFQRRQKSLASPCNGFVREVNSSPRGELSNAVSEREGEKRCLLEVGNPVFSGVGQTWDSHNQTQSSGTFCSPSGWPESRFTPRRTDGRLADGRGYVVSSSSEQ